MRDPERIDRILKKLGSYWKENPDLRLCQIMVNLSGKVDSFFVEDDVIEEAIDQVVGPKINDEDEKSPAIQAIIDYFEEHPMTPRLEEAMDLASWAKDLLISDALARNIKMDDSELVRCSKCGATGVARGCYDCMG